jgi:catechol 2,3-dioxygenase-like lactoylglutathione lyase family enzyme
MDHLALAVRDQEQSRRFYETYFGFDASPPHRYPDGTLMLYNDEGFALALGQVDGPFDPLPFFHFGTGAPDAATVRTFGERLRREGIPIVEEWDEPAYVSIKCRDPDGYVVEYSWEPDIAA